MNTTHTPPPFKGPLLDLMTDFGFKKCFGPGRKRQLVDILNALLPNLPGPIVDLEYMQQEHLGETQEERRAVFDLYCRSKQGQWFIVEVQKAPQHHYMDRSLYYAALGITRQAQKGDWRFELATVYSINFLEFLLPKDLATPECEISKLALCNTETYGPPYEKLQMVYIELPKFSKEKHEVKNHRDAWLYLLKNSAKIESMEDLPPLVRQGVFMEFLENAQIANLSLEEQIAYERNLKAYRDNINTMAYAKEKAFEQGLEEGVEQGIKLGEERGMEQGIKLGEEKGIKLGEERIALRMLALGFDDGTILNATDLSSAHLERLKPLAQDSNSKEDEQT